MSDRFWLVLAMALAVVAAPELAWAHMEPGVAQGLISGFKHPILGTDHLVAMVAVGLWGAQLGAPAIWMLPVAFPLVMALGGLLGLSGMILPLPDLFIAVSALVLGGAVAFGLQAPLWIACALVGIFAIFHGFSHGVGLRGATDVSGFAVGFVIATGLLHLVGITVGLLTKWRTGAIAVRLAGSSVAAVGLATLLATVIAI